MFQKIKSSIRQPNSVGLIFNVSGALLLACAANVFVFALHLDSDDKGGITFPIAGYIIDIVWILLFTLMGLAKWLLNFNDDTIAKKSNLCITILICSCAAWVFLLAAHNIYVGLAGNFAIILVSIITIGYCLKISKAVGMLILPVLVWVSFATVILIVMLYRR